MLRRRAPEAAQEPLAAGALKLDPVDASRDRQRRSPSPLGPTEFRLLRFLLARPERVHSRAQLLDQVWGDHVYIEERTVDVHIRRLRLALEPFGLDESHRNGARQRLSARRAALRRTRRTVRRPSPLIVQRVAAPAARAGRWRRSSLAFAGGAVGVRRPRARLGRRSSSTTSSTSIASTHWAAGVAGRAGARRQRAVARRRSPRSIARVRTRRAHERDLAHTIERFQSAAEAIPDGMVVLDARESHQVGEPCARSRCSGSISRQDIGAPLVNLVRQPEFVRYLEVGRLSRAASSSSRSAMPA